MASVAKLVEENDEVQNQRGKTVREAVKQDLNTQQGCSLEGE